MKKISILVILITLFSCISSKAPEESIVKEAVSANKVENTKPKLIIGIVVDQMRYDYLTRFYSKYGTGGFRRLMSEGFNFKNAHYNYIPTYTGPGHASIYTGATPKTHSILGNNWYDKYQKSTVYCSGDKTVKPLGTNHKAGLMSPYKMKTTTFGDENRLFTQFKGKTIGISLKDRGAILSAGHTANAAYWFHGENEGVFISSSYYFNSLPKWVQDFNQSRVVKSYLKKWNTLYPIETYTESGLDDNTFEYGFKNKSTFPYDLAELLDPKKPFNIIKSTPYGNSLLVDFTIEAIKNENLGKDNFTDILTISFSSTDYVGHNFGVNSKEIEDTYIRLDKNLERFLNYLDDEVGKSNYTLFLTSDHGAINVPSYLQTKKIPSGYVDIKKIRAKLEIFLKKKFTVSNLIENISNNQIYLSSEVLENNKLSKKNVETSIVNELLAYDTIYKAYRSKTLIEKTTLNNFEILLQNGINQKYSGNVIFVFNPNYISYSKKGSTHGSGFNYDTHVPLLFYGNGISKGESFDKTEITSITPTISALLGIGYPNGSSTLILSEALH